jgi:hypothetical protein
MNIFLQQLKGMAEKLPEGAGAGAGPVKHNRLPPLSGMPVPSDISVATENLGSPRGSGEPYLNGSNGLVVSNGPSSVRNKTHLEVGKNGTRLPDSDTKLESEWVEQDEPGVYITLTALPGGARDLKRVRFRYIPIAPFRNGTINHLKNFSTRRLCACYRYIFNSCYAILGILLI